jgi:hypothetical protein
LREAFLFLRFWQPDSVCTRCRRFLLSVSMLKYEDAINNIFIKSPLPPLCQRGIYFFYKTNSPGDAVLSCPPKIVILLLLASSIGTPHIIRASIRRCPKTTPIHASLIGFSHRSTRATCALQVRSGSRNQRGKLQQKSVDSASSAE